MDPIELCKLVVRAEFYLLFGAFGAGLSLLMTTWHLYRKMRFLSARLEHCAQERIADVNETLRITSTAYASAEPTTLEDLLSSAERDFSLRSSKR